MLSDGFWQRRFAGDRNVINQTITLDNESYTVIGVMPAGVSVSTSEFYVG